MRKRNRFIRIVIPVFLVIVSFLSLAFYTKVSVEQAEQDAYQVLSDSARAQAATLSAKLEGQYIVLEAFAKAVSTQDSYDIDNLVVRMNAIVETSPFHHIAVVTPDGSAYLDDGQETNVADRNYFKEAMAGRRAIEKVDTGRLEQEPRFILSVPIPHDSEIPGVIYGSFNEEGLRAMLVSEAYGRRGYSHVCDSSGRLILASGSGDSLFGENGQGSPNIFDVLKDMRFSKAGDYDQFVANIQNGESGSVFYAAEKNERYAYYEPLGISDWYILNVLPAAVVEESVSKTLWTALFPLGIIMSCTILMCVFALYRERKTRRSLLAAESRIRRALETDRENLFHRKEEYRMEALNLQARANGDALTGVLNRGAFVKQVAELLAGSRDSTHALVMIDLDGFKQINDTLGHMEGDQILVDIARNLKSILRSGDFLGRIGGDEFMLCMRDVPYDEVIGKRAQLICSLLRLDLGDKCDLKISGSLGIAMFPRDGRTFDELYRHADVAMYRAKQQGRDGYVFYRPEDDAAL